MRISKIMKGPVLSIRPESTVRELDQLMSKNHISGVPVLSEDLELLGVVSKTDVIRSFTENPEIFQSNTCVWEIMTPEVLCVQANDDIASVAQKMLAARVHRVLIYEGGELVGLVSTFDFLEVVAKIPGDAD